tara:strand:- start:179 stop:340 length:162 start_codon:yes stop_codon:yes gene_type:complete
MKHHILITYILSEYYQKKREEKNLIKCQNIYKTYLKYLKSKDINISFLSFEDI